jgi:hypothetical protein
MSIDIHRMAAMMHFCDNYGMSPNDAALPVAALHPLDDSPVPSRAFEKAVRKRSRQFAKAARRLQNDPQAVYRLAAETVLGYQKLARDMGETYYIDRWAKVLSKV